jgi:hypothetical protein
LPVIKIFEYIFYNNLLALSALIPLLMALYSSHSAQAQSARAVRGAASVVPLTSEPAAKLVVDAPLPDQLALGRVVLQYRTENLRIVPVYGPAALDVSPRVGHLHITVDGAAWHWLDASNEPITIMGLPASSHIVLVELADPTHKVIDAQTVTFVIPTLK